MAWENFHGRTLGGKRGSNYQKALPNLSKVYILGKEPLSHER